MTIKRRHFWLITLTALLICTSAHAAVALPGPSDGRLVGLFSGAALVGLVGYALYVYLSPLAHEEDGGLLWAVLALAAITVLKFALLPIFPGLGIDVGSYQAWALQLADQGPARIYQPGYFIDYPPGYLYGLWAAGSLARALHANGEIQRIIVESPPVLCDALLGLVIFALVRRTRDTAWAYGALALFALNPALIFDTVVWGQSDSIFTLLVLLSLLMLAELEYELGWGLAALALLVKPQAVMLLPVLALWSVLNGRWREWGRCALAFIVVALIGIAPFQIAQRWDWLFKLYSATAGYYHETSVNAFNLMALVGGLRQGDSGNLLPGITFFEFGMALLVPLYCFIGYLLWRKPRPQILLLSGFLALLGFFICAPRMHERYLYPAVAFAVPLAIESPLMLGVLATLSLTLLFNLAYVKRALENNYFLGTHDGLAMAASSINVVALAASLWYGWQQLSHTATQRISQVFRSSFSAASEQPHPPTERDPFVATPFAWQRIDSIIITVLLAIGAFIHFWRIGQPPEIVFDEVHFVGQARHYLHGENFLDPHPPIAKLLIALGIALFGDHPWSWRLANALIGTLLIGITYLLARRMFGSRMSATLSAAFVLGDGMFLVDSRIAVLDIVYLTFAAWAYLMLFKYAQTEDWLKRRQVLAVMAVALGLCLASKLYVPAITFLLVAGFVIYIIARARPVTETENRDAQPLSPGAVRRQQRRQTRERAHGTGRNAWLERQIGGSAALVCGIAAVIYVLSFLPHFLLGWWGGIADLFDYFGKVMWYEQSVASATHPYAAPWWSWPLMLRPIAYWQNFPPNGNIVATIWGGGNPALWWGALVAVMIFALQAYERRTMARLFVVVGYLAYLAMWVPIGRTLFLYHYMPCAYLGFLALADVLTECWEGRSLLWEKAALLFTLIPLFVFSMGAGLGTIACLALLAAFVYLLAYDNYAGKLVSGLYIATATVLFFYYFPLWVGLPIARAGYYARMWLQGPGLRNWI